MQALGERLGIFALEKDSESAYRHGVGMFTSTVVKEDLDTVMLEREGGTGAVVRGRVLVQWLKRKCECSGWWETGGCRCGGL